MNCAVKISMIDGWIHEIAAIVASNTGNKLLFEVLHQDTGTKSWEEYLPWVSMPSEGPVFDGWSSMLTTIIFLSWMDPDQSPLSKSGHLAAILAIRPLSKWTGTLSTGSPCRQVGGLMDMIGQ